MSEYSVEEVRAKFEAHHGITWEAIQSIPIGSGSRMHLESHYKRHFDTWQAAYAERIKADERAAQWQSMDSAPRDGTVILLRWGEDAITPGWWCGDVALPPDHGPSDEYLWKFIDARSAEFNRYFVNSAKDNEYGPSHWAPYLEARLFATPPAQAAQVPDAVRVALDEMTADMGYLFGRVAADGSCANAMAESVRAKLKVIDEWMPSRDAYTAEPVAQGEAITGLISARQPKKTAGFSWGRSVRDGTVIYRLFRRDQLGRIHCKQVVPNHAWPRYVIAYELNRARHALRDQVDEVDLALMGVTQ